MNIAEMVRRFDGMIFDMDGTLLDSMYVWERIAGDYLRTQGITPPPDVRERIRKLSLRQAAKLFKAEYHVTKRVEEIMDEVNGMIARQYREEVQPKPGVIAFLEALRTAQVKMCVATNTDIHLVETALQRTGLRQYFSAVFTCDQVGHGKDEPHIFREALAHLGTQVDRTAVVEDALHAARTAKNAGFPVIGIYDRSEPGQQELQALADVFIRDFRRID